MESFDIKVIANEIELSGTLDGSAAMLLLGQQTLAGLSVPKGTIFKIHATKAGMNRAGVKIWIDLVNQYLMNYELVYTDSQLSSILESYPGYNHSKSTFQGGFKK